MVNRGGTISIYFKKEYLDYVQNNIEDFPSFIRSKLDEEMKCNVTSIIKSKEQELKTYTKQCKKLTNEIKLLKKTSVEKNEAREELYKIYDNINSNCRKGFITGAKGINMLIEAGLSETSFIKLYRVWKANVR